MNGHRSSPDAHGRESLREDLQEFLGLEAPLHLLDDLTKVNPVTLETGMGLSLFTSAISKRVEMVWIFSTASSGQTKAGRTPDLESEELFQTCVAAAPGLPSTDFAANLVLILIRSCTYSSWSCWDLMALG